MKNSLPLEASWWAEFRTPFRMSNFIIFMQLPYISFLKYFAKTVTAGNFIMSRIQNTFQNVEVCYFYAAAYINFVKYNEKPLPLEATWWAEFRPFFRMSNFIIIMQQPYISFLKYYENSPTVGSVMMNRIQNPFQNFEFSYFYAAAIY